MAHELPIKLLSVILFSRYILMHHKCLPLTVFNESQPSVSCVNGMIPVKA